MPFPMSPQMLMATNARRVLTEPLSFTGTLTLQDTLDLHRVHSRVVLRRSIRYLMAVFSLLIATLVIWAGTRSQFTAVSFAILGLCAYFPFGWLALDRLSVARNYRRHPEHFIEHTVTFTDASISASSINADVRVNWNQLAAIVSTPRGLLFLLPPHNVWFWLPQRLFENNDHKETILAFAAEHSISIRRMA